MKLEKLSENLYARRKSRGLSQEEFAEQIHVSRQAISKWERGEAYPDIENLIAIADFYGITLDELVKDGTEESEIYTDDHLSINIVESIEDEQCESDAEEEETESGLKVQGDFELRFDEIPYSIIVTVVYLLLGFLTPRGWQIWWTLYITIPVYSSLIECFRKKRFSPFAYPVFVAFLYLLFGMAYGAWHPMWIVFITVPIYYSIATLIDRAIKKKKAKE